MAVDMRVRTVLSYGTGGPGLHTVYWRPGTTGGVTADATDAVARVRAFWSAAAGLFPNTFGAQVSSDVALIEDSTGALVGGLSATPVAVVAGTASGSFGPLANMALLRLRTGVVVNGRALRGRWYLGPTAANAINALGGLTTGNIAALNAAGAGMLAAGATTSFPVVWHRPGAGTGISANITSMSAWDQLAVMRSRRDA